MTDLERRQKVIKGLECCMLSYKDGCDECPYIDKGMCQELLGEHAIALLKTQKPIKPTIKDGYAYCGKCGHVLLWIAEKNKYCPNCGKAVKWDG